MLPEIDLFVLSRDDSPLIRDVERGITAQQGVRLRVQRVFGRALPGDANRWQTIARARNAAKALASAEWVFFLDDDVVLPPDCIRRLWERLERDRVYGALAADYREEAVSEISAVHVAMGAALFRREALRLVTFRWKAKRCECLCCCDDLRRCGYAIDYLPGALARHLTKDRDASTTCAAVAPSGAATEPKTPPGYVLAAFDRFHLRRFTQQFLPSLRAHGNRETVLVVAYGLSPAEQRRLTSCAGVEGLFLPRSNIEVPVRRLQDFQRALDRLPPDAAAAYWDAGDVVFHGGLQPLWQEAARFPDRLLAVQEPMLFQENAAMLGWTSSIRSQRHRQIVRDLLIDRRVLNSGFAAGTVEALRRYFQASHQLRHSEMLGGTTDWGDQMALNVYCYSDANHCRIVDEGWNYCLCGRAPSEFQITADGWIRSTKRIHIRAVHGNGGTLHGVAGVWRLRQKLTGLTA